MGGLNAKKKQFERVPTSFSDESNPRAAVLQIPSF